MKGKLKTFVFGVLVFVAFLSMIKVENVFAGNEGAKSFKVLVLQSYHRSLSWTDSIDKGIEKVFGDSDLDITLQIEYMDTKRVYDKKYKKQLFDLLEYKYIKDEFDLIISADNNAFDFLIEYRNELFGVIPVVFCGVNNFSDEMIAGVEQFTGAVEEVSFKETIDVALSLHPQAKQFVIYETDTTTFKANKASLNEIEGLYTKEVAFKYIQNSNMELIEQHANALGSDAIVLVVSSMKDKDGKILSFTEYARRVSRATRVPVYSFWDFNLGHGIVGGKLVSGKAHGITAANIALEILRGTSPSRIPVIKKSPNEYMFDIKQLRRFKIKEKLLPPGSIVVNRGNSFFERNYSLILKVLGLFTFLFVLILLLIVDIASRQRTEAVLRESERRFREILESSSDWIWEVDTKGIYTYVSSNVKKILGYTPEEILGKSPFDLMPEEESDNMSEKFKKIVKDKANIENLENKNLHKDGHLVVLETNGVPIVDNDGHLRGYRGVDRDITKRKKAENKLRDSEEKFNKAFYSVSATMVISELETGRIVDVNNMFLENMGYRREEVIGKTSKELGMFHDYSDRERMKEMMLKMGYIRNMEVPIRTNRNEIRLGLVAADFIHLQEKEMMLTIVTDITELKKSQEMMVQSEKMLSVGGLAAGIAHEINNPLAGILQNMQVIISRLKKDQAKSLSVAAECGLDMDALEQFMEKRDINTMLGSVMDSGQRAAKIVNNILSFSRKSQEQFAEFDLAKLMDKAIGLAKSDYDLKKQYDFKKIEIDYKSKDDPFIVSCEGNQIQQVFFNILRNGAQAMLGVLEPKFTINMYSQDDDVVVEIIDNGIGMDSSITNRIFEPFFTTKDVGKGTGLGLSVSYFIVVEKHNGKLEVETQAGKGAKFIIVLPKNGAKRA